MERSLCGAGQRLADLVRRHQQPLAMDQAGGVEVRCFVYGL